MLKLFDIKKFPSKIGGLNEELKANYIIELYKKFGDAIKAIKERKCVAKYKITKKIKIEPIYYTTKVEV